MALKITKEQAYQRGRQAATKKGSADEAQQEIENGFTWARNIYEGAAELDMVHEITEFSRERLASDLDLTLYPECRGLADLVIAERQGFAEVCSDPFIAAHHFDWRWFVSRRLNTRFVGRQPPPAQCTDFWFADTAEGGPIHGCNRDDVLFRYGPEFPRERAPKTGPGEWQITGVTAIGGVSASVLCDEEPECLFPVDMAWITPDDCANVREHMDFMSRYREFWGPGNRLYVDAEMNFAAVEKANVRFGVRYSSGCCAITACAYLTPEMNAFKLERDKLSYAARGWSHEDNPDKRYWDGCERRYRRLLELVENERARGATVVGAAQIALDHAVPAPDRVCVAGESTHPDDKMLNWTLSSFARCISGPNRRMLFWIIDPSQPQPIYTRPCHVLPGLGLEARLAEWEQEVADAGEIGLRPAE